MKKNYTSSILSFGVGLLLTGLSAQVFAQTPNLGVDVPNPQEKVDVNGAIRIGTTANSNAGTIRYVAGTQKFQINKGGIWYDMATTADASAGYNTSFTINGSNVLSLSDGNSTLTVNLSQLVNDADASTSNELNTTVSFNSTTNVLTVTDPGGSLTANLTALRQTLNDVYQQNGNNVQLNGTAGDVRFYKTGNEMLTIQEASGNVGIGTSNPAAAKLTIVETATGSALSINESSDGDGLAITETGLGNGLSVVGGGLGHSAVFTGGNVGIGTTNPARQLEVTGAARVTGLASGANGALVKSNTSGDLAAYNFTNNSNQVLDGVGNFTDINTILSGDYIENQNSSNQTASFRISGDGIFNGGNVGIGTTTPETQLHIKGASSLTQTDYTQNINKAGIILRDDYSNGVFSGGLFWGSSNIFQSRPKAGIYLNSTSAGSKLIFSTSTDFVSGITNDAMVIDADANVGIGTFSPQHLLDVAGDVNVSSGSGFKINGTATNGQYLRGNGTRFVSSTIAYSDISGTPSSLPPNGAASGDLSGTYPGPTVARLRGTNVSTTAPTANQVLKYNSGTTQWEPATDNGLTAAILSLNGLTGATQTIANDANVTMTSVGTTHTIGWTGQLSVPRGGTGAATLTSGGILLGNGTGAITTSSAPTVSGQYLRSSGAGTWALGTGIPYSDVTGAPSSLPPSGAAGNDLSGTYPNPTVARINGVALGSTTATAGRILVANGTQWVSVDMSGDATISSAGVVTVNSSSNNYIKNQYSAAQGTPGSFWISGIARTGDGSAAAPSFTFNSSGTTGIYSPAAGQIGFSTAGTEAARIVGSNLGIGNTAPGATLEINTSAAGWSGGTGTTSAIINGPNSALSGGGMVKLISTTAPAANLGGSLSLGGMYDAALSSEFAEIAGRKESATLANNAGYFTIATRSTGAALTEKLRITSNGNVGIANTSPDRKLHVTGGNGDGIAVERDASTNGEYTSIYFKVDANDSFQYFKGGVLYERENTNGIGKLHLATNNAADATNVTLANARLTVTSDGNIGIGTVTPTNKLEVAGGDINVDAGQGFKINGTAAAGEYLRGDGTRYVSSTIAYSDITGTPTSLAPSGAAGGDLAGSTYPNPVIAANAITTAKISNDQVTNAKLANMAAYTVKVNATSAAADPTDLAIAANSVPGRLGANIVSIPMGTAANTLAWGDHTHSQLHNQSHAMTSTTDHTATAWRVFYSNGSGQVAELGLGTSGQVLKSNGAAAAPSFQSETSNLTGSGAAGRVTYWNGTSSITSDANFLWDNATARLGIGTTTAAASTLSVYDGANATKTTFTQALADNGILISSNYVDGSYTPGVFWSTHDNNATKPKAGIFLQETGSGTNMYLGTSNTYATGITNDGIVINPVGNVGLSSTAPTQKLDVIGNAKANLFYAASNGTAAAPAFTWNSDANNGMYRITTDVVGFSTAGVERMRIAANGNIGVGSATPGQKLDVTGNIRAATLATIGTHPSYSGYVSFWKDGSDYTVLSDGTSSFFNAPLTTGNIYLRANNSDRMVITGSNGDIALNGKHAIRSNDSWLRLNQTGAFTSGVYTPGLLRADGQIKILHTSPTLYLEDQDNPSYFLHCNSDRLYVLHGATAGTTWNTNRPLTIYQGNKVGINNDTPSYALHVVGKVKSDGINETSDARLKKDVTAIENPLEKVMALQGVTYNWKIDEYPEKQLEEGMQYGLIAQELEKVIPELVSTDNEGWKSIEYSHLVPVLIEALKEQQKTIEGLNSNLNEMRAERSQDQELLNKVLDRLKALETTVEVKTSVVEK